MLVPRLPVPQTPPAQLGTGGSWMTGVYPAQVDGLQGIPVVPGDSREVAVPDCEYPALSLVSEELSEGDLRSPPGHEHPQFLSALSCYPMAELASQV